MSQVNRFFRLPPPTQREVEARLAANGFSDYEAIAAELQGRGHRISKSALHRHGQQLKKSVATAPAQRHALARLR
jgi:hypothetical protein